MNNASQITSTVYRYEALLQAINFFTQRFNIEHLSEYAFDFTNEILTLKSSALFIREGKDFVLKNKRFYNLDKLLIKSNSNIESIATFHGNIITSNFEKFFSKEIIKHINIKLVLPLIINDYLYGFILSDGKSIGKFDDSDFTIAKVLMRLFNNSLENSKVFSDLKITNKELDQKVFNLLAVSQSSKLLLSEIDLNKLYNTATDIFSELTGSSVTSFGIFDERSGCVKIQGYRNISNFSNYYTELIVEAKSFNDKKIVLDVENDKDIIKSIFTNWDEFYKLDARYVVLIIKNKLIGLVTLSESILNSSYSDSMFELIESLASFTHIALTNATLFEEIRKQKELIEKKFQVLVNLNKLVKNINGCETLDELYNLTLKTLKVSFNIQKAFIIVKENDYLVIKSSIGFHVDNNKVNIDNNWNDALCGQTIYNFSALSPYKYFDESFKSLFGETNCIIISPINIERSSAISQREIMGYIVVIKVDKTLQDEEILLIDTIAQNISPIIYHMNSMSEIKKTHILNPSTSFLKALDEKIKDREEYDVDFNIYYKKFKKHPFKALDLKLYNKLDYHIIDDYIFVVTYDNLDDYDFSILPTPNSIDEFLQYQF